jgi:RNA polymerase sigma-70 factor, ECF subfamily
VSATFRTEDPNDAQAVKLGDVLYADPARSRVPETEWVQLVQAIAAGEELALHELFERMHRVVFTLILRIVNNRETAEELTLDVFHEVWRRAAAFDLRGGSVVGWIMMQARSRAIDRLRFEQRKKRVNPEPAECREDATSGSSETVEREEQVRLLQHALARLTADERLAIECAYFGECSYSEAAARLNEPVGTVKTRIRSGLGKLRQALAGHGAP